MPDCAESIFKCHFLAENFAFWFKSYVPNGLIDNKAPLIQLMAWPYTGDKPLSKAMMTEFNDATSGNQGTKS